ncbi:MAG TPA: glycerol-3-phosphate 1-O-acyltransferase PlsY [Opitutus sp.]|nr:glycerol-3-phosphate 1-O-acyltransferase PlsY [Opitutus sp.]
MLLSVLLALVLGYLLGSLPFGYLVARAKGVNIFEVGSKNPGATNVRRVLGKGPGNLVFALDALKGAVATGWPLLHLDWSGAGGDLSLAFSSGAEASNALSVAGLIGALVGHSYSCFTGFRGGKGVATSLGGLLIVLPLATLIAGGLWLVTFFASRYVSLASIVAAVALVLATVFLQSPGLLVSLAGIVAAFVVLRHRTNIVRLLNGTENKFVKKSAAPKS